MIPVKEKATARCSVGVYILAHSGDIVYPQNKVKEVLFWLRAVTLVLVNLNNSELSTHNHPLQYSAQSRGPTRGAGVISRRRGGGASPRPV